MAFPQSTPPQVAERTRGLGSSSSRTLKTAFGGPINNQEDQFSSVEELRKQYENLVMNANSALAGSVAAYYGITDYSPDYVDAPNLEDVETGAGGLPGTPYIPNVASPGEGSDLPSDLPAPPEGIGVEPTGSPFSGPPITANNPQASSKKAAGTAVGQGSYKSGISKASE